MATQRGLSYASWKRQVNNARLSPEQLTSPVDDALGELKELMGPEEFRRFFNKVYDRYRDADVERYERILRYRLKMIKRNKAGRS